MRKKIRLPPGVSRAQFAAALRANPALRAKLTSAHYLSTRHSGAQQSISDLRAALETSKSLLGPDERALLDLVANPGPNVSRSTYYRTLRKVLANWKL